MTTKAKKLKIRISEEIGSVSTLLLLPDKAHSLIVLSHGAGAGMEHPFMESLAAKLAAYGVGSLRFNFAYMEKGSGPPDRPKKAHAVIAKAVDKGIKLADGRTLLAGGKSFGGRMMSQMAATGTLDAVSGVVYYGFPLHAPGRPGIERAAHLSDIAVPQLFLQGTRDKLAEPALIKKVCSGLQGARLVTMEGADHSFKTLKRSGIDPDQVMEKLAQETVDFAKSL